MIHALAGHRGLQLTGHTLSESAQAIVHTLPPVRVSHKRASATYFDQIQSAFNSPFGELESGRSLKSGECCASAIHEQVLDVGLDRHCSPSPQTSDRS